MKKYTYIILMFFITELVAYPFDFEVLHDSVSVKLVGNSSENMVDSEAKTVILEPTRILRLKSKEKSFKENLLFEDFENGNIYSFNVENYSCKIPIDYAIAKVVDENNFTKDELLINSAITYTGNYYHGFEESLLKLCRHMPKVLENTNLDSIRIFAPNTQTGFVKLSKSQLAKIFSYINNRKKMIFNNDIDSLRTDFALVKEIYQYDNLPEYAKIHLWEEYFRNPVRSVLTKQETKDYKESFLKFITNYENKIANDTGYESTYGINAMHILEDKHKEFPLVIYPFYEQIIEVSKNKEVLILAYSKLIRYGLMMNKYDDSLKWVLKSFEDFKKEIVIVASKDETILMNTIPVEHLIYNYTWIKSFDDLLRDLDILIKDRNTLPSLVSYLHLRKGELIYEDGFDIEKAIEEFDQVDFALLQRYMTLSKSRLEKIGKIKNYKIQKLFISGLLRVKKDLKKEETIEFFNDQYTDVITYSSEEYKIIEGDKNNPLKFNWIKVLVNDEIYFLEDKGYKRITIE